LDLQLTHRGDYAIRAAIALAREAGTGRYVKLREISEEMAIPRRYTQEILTLLTRAGLADARAGKTGGYRLIKHPDDVSLLDVVEAAEGPLRLDRCTLSGGPCHWEETVCAVHAMWEQANAALVTTLRGQSLSKVLRVDNRLRSRHGAGEAAGEKRATPGGG
jgi:Rrf2 family transcriptional regulator, iron-sulfur cluster assembly transcription factor